MNNGLYIKKHEVRKALHAKGMLQRKGSNTFDRYKYFTEAQYKELFTELLTDASLDLSFSIENVENYTGTDKQPFGRIVYLRFVLTDVDTGDREESLVVGEGMDKGDKAVYKAMTGALKYYFANTFLVVTGDEVEAYDATADELRSKLKGMAEIKGIDLDEELKRHGFKEVDKMTKAALEAAVKVIQGL